MSSKNKIVALVFLILASLSLWLYLHNSESSIRKELFDFAIADTGVVTKIYMINTEGKQVTLEKTKPGEWKVNGKYIARIDAIKSLLFCMKEMQVRNPVAKSAIESVSKQMATASTKVEIYQEDKLIKTYYVGSDTQDMEGTFMLLSDPETGENSTLPFVMYIQGFNGILSVRYFLDENEWRNKSVFAFLPDQISSISVAYMHLPDSSFTISLSDANDITLSDGKGKNIPDFDTAKVKRYITYYTNIPFEAFKNDLRQSFKDSVIGKGIVQTIKLKDRKGKIHTVKTFAKPQSDTDSGNDSLASPVEDLEKMFALVNDDKDFVTIQYYTFGKLLQGISYFMKPSSLNKAIGVKK